MPRTWDPWSELKTRRHLRVKRFDLPESTGGALYWPTRRGATIFLDYRADRVRRRCLLAHELVHDERHGGCSAPYMPPSWEAVVAREENWVNNTVADRLVPPDELAALCAGRADAGLEVTAVDVAEYFDITPAVAVRALVRLERRLKTYTQTPRLGDRAAS